MCFFHKSYPSQYKSEVAALTSELIQIGLKEDYLSERSGGLFDRNCRHARAREIGERLYSIGGIPLMEEILKKVSTKCGKDSASPLEACGRAVGGVV